MLPACLADGARRARAWQARVPCAALVGLAAAADLLSGASAFAAIEAAITLQAIAPEPAGRSSIASPASPASRGEIWELRRGPRVLARFRVTLPTGPSEDAPRTPRGETPAQARPHLEGLPPERRVVDGHHLLLARVQLHAAGGPATQRDAQPLPSWLWMGEEVLPSGGVREIWSGRIGPQDADGETSRIVEIGADGILEFQTAAQISRCDDQPIRLFPRAWDFAARRFEPVGSPVPEPSPIVVTAHRDDPAMPSAAPLGGFRFTAASTRLGDGADARNLGPPTGLEDGDPATTWVAGAARGPGTFLTARAFGGAYGVRGLRIVPGDATSTGAFRARDRLRALTVITGPRAGQRFDVVFPEDPATAARAGARDPRSPYWIPFPETVASSCLTVVIRDVYPGDATAISELRVFTELDFANGLERLIADAATGSECAARVPLLAKLGEAAVLPLAQAVLGASGMGRECLVDALASIPATGQSTVAIDALVAALRGASPGEEAAISRAIFGAMGRVPRPPVSTIAELLRDPRATPEDRARAARLLGRLPAAATTATARASTAAARAAATTGAVDATRDAVRALLDAVGDGPPEVRLAVIQAISESIAPPQPSAAPGAERAAATAEILATVAAGAGGTIASTPARGPAATARPHRAADLLRLLPALATHAPPTRATAVQILRGALGAGQPYELQARAIGALGAIAAAVGPGAAAQAAVASPDGGQAEPAAPAATSAACAEALVQLRATSPDPVLRALATRELAGLAGAAVFAEPTGPGGLRPLRPALRAALGDADPRVREAAAQGLGSPSDVVSEAALIEAAKREPWPFARSAEVAALGRSCGAPARALLVRAIERDTPEVRRVALVGLDGCGEPRMPRFLLTILRTVTADPSLRELAAGLCGGRGHGPDAPALAHALADALPSLANEAEGDLAIEAVTIAALRSLGALGGPDAARAAAALARDAAHPYRHVATEVLGRICDPGVGAATLAALRASPDAELALAAQSSERACRERSSPGADAHAGADADSRSDSGRGQAEPTARSSR
jgi:hypothetical protein